MTRAPRPLSRPGTRATIERLAAEGRSQSYIAQHFGVTQQSISLYCQRRAIWTTGALRLAAPP